jgi:hypothetical protein
LKGCDVNKDIEIDDVTQLTLTDMQMPLVEKARRAYVKVIGDKAYLRVETRQTSRRGFREYELGQRFFEASVIEGCPISF